MCFLCQTCQLSAVLRLFLLCHQTLHSVNSYHLYYAYQTSKGGPEELRLAHVITFL